MDMYLIWHEIGGVLLVAVGFLIREAMERWKDYHLALQAHEQRVNEWRRSQGTEPEHEPAQAENRAARCPRMVGRFPWARFERKLRATGHAGARRIDGEWRMM